jgi:hypothetical protein
MDRRPQELVDELRRAIAQTADSAEQRAMLQKLALLERGLVELDRREREIQAADALLARARSAQLVWRIAIGILVVALIGAGSWLVAGLLQWL